MALAASFHGRVGVERRRSERVPVRWRMSFKAGRGRMADGVTVNVSNDGILFETHCRLRPGQRVELDVTVGAGRFFRCSGVVVRAEALDAGFWGCAVALDELSRTDRQILSQSLDSHERKGSTYRTLLNPDNHQKPTPRYWDPWALAY
jgi:hypothetical protein